MVNLTDSTGEITKSYTYDAFGVEKNIDDSDTNAFRYCEEYYDSESGTIYLRARYYDPSTGRFVSRDSYAGKNEDPLSLNRYTYCHNNPTNNVDPNGKFAVALIVGTAAAAAVVACGAYQLSKPETQKALSECGNQIRNTLSGWKKSYNQKKANLILSSVIYSLKVMSYTGIINSKAEEKLVNNDSILQAKKSKSSGKERATDIPSWARGKRPLPGESGNDFARRVCDEKYGPGNYEKGPGTDYNKLRKYGDRAFK